MKKNVSALIFSLIVSLTYSQVITPFIVKKQLSQKGGIVYLSNVATHCNINPPTAGGACQTGANEVPPAGTYQDNSFNAVYVDMDGDATTFQSSRDALTLPACSEISWAGLFWGASMVTFTSTSYQTIKIKANAGAYQNLTATNSQTNAIGFNTYHCFADVTNFMKTAGINATVTVANILTDQIGVANRFGSWTMVIMYKNDLQNMRQLTCFEGLANIAGTSTVNIPVSGFLTPLSGPVSFETGIYVHDGDRGLTGDQLRFNGGTGFVNITDAVNPTTNMMNSTCSRNGTLTPNRIPNLNNTAGLDADIYFPNNSTKNYLGNAVTSATFQMTTTSETYLPQMITTAIDIYEPDLRASIKVRDVNLGSVMPGDILEYTIKGINIGSDPSVNTFLLDTIEANAIYIPNSTKIIYGPNLGTKTDATGDDQVEYLAASRVLRIRIGNGANAVTGGTVNNSPTGLDSTLVTYSVTVTQSCVKLLCDNVIDARAYILGTGAVSTNTFSNGSNPGVFDVFGCPIAGTTSTPITSTACATPTAVNSSPVCSGGSLFFNSSNDTEALYSWSGPSSFTSTIQNPTIAVVSAANAGLYTVTLSVTGYTCQYTASTTVSLNLCPTAVNDATNTIQNTPVSGNAASNDINAIGGTFSNSQPSAGTGTLVMNPATGQYTYTPATGFTGTTSATYTLCNGLPLVCSSATITFTVFPTLVANPDPIVTTPSVSVTGTLLTNDLGTSAPGATYSVSVTQPAPTTGTIVLNPATGQYTFNPNPSFTGTAQTTYTVCNTAVNPTVCSNSTITIQVGNLPLAVADATTTMQNTSVSGTVATNDTGANSSLSPVFTNSQPTAGTGTLTMNPATGQYTFTPATGFTGTTVATYTLCNLLSPPCSTTTITFTVFPTLVANPDPVVTTPSVSVTGTLTGNDLGIVTGGTYSTSVTQPSPTTGTIVINPATGQYTFVPNPSFTGTAQTTYTVCNTAVNPIVCSNTTITIQVGDFPLAVVDATTTMQNTPVSGTVATNDIGAGSSLSPVFTNSQPTAGTGTLTMNPATGQYTFTPATGFTGTTVATYTLCNLLSPPCSTTTITFTVFPTLVANPDPVVTTPSVSVTGTLTGNDLGIVTGGTYSTSVTQPSPTTGTIIINPATGQYTFVPNPSFTGTAQTTYTVCNTAVNPTVCSNSTITIQVGDLPLAVSDATTTLINTPVSGTVATNDIGASSSLSPVFTNSQPTAGTGTLTMNPTTGQYTFTPATGFTGTTSATYTLCNILSPPCSTTTITFTVFPTLVANPDVITTTPSVSVTGTLTTNDLGIVPGGTYSTTVTQPAPTTGTITVNPATGQYTFVPNPSFTGTAQTTYTVCQYVPPSTVAIQCSSSTITIIVSDLPIAVADSATTLINTPVSGNAGTNDLGTTGGTFTTSQPTAGTGTIVMNPATGQYTYTPATGFTGTTSVTYTLCNLASPPCSTTTITFTVFPALVANPDPIVTTPSVSVTGTLTTNDLGIVPGGTYSTTVTQPAPTTGTIIVNPATGQYTFVPNPTFTGTTQTTYTVCQFVPPSTVAVQCSASTITIIVSDLPIAVADSATTLINTPVSGNAGTNDSGTSGGTFTSSQPTAGTGTLVMNPSTGQYTYTPATGFTGTTVATYTLCNLASPPCSTTTITFTVFPALVAVNDPIVTTPSVSVTGTLTGNDIGLVPGGTYSTTVTQPSPTTGTIVINPSTGQYTFVPNPSFSGTAQTTYTICQYVPPSTVALQCSTATITINVSNVPVAVNDATVTLINVPVSGTVGGNDVGVSTGTFTPGNPTSGTGTIVMDPTTGQYTFTPATGFTGTTSVTYTVCAGVPVTCVSAVLTITVFPSLVANLDPIVTTPSVSVTGTLTGNDGGLVSGGTYSTTVTQPSPTTGTIIINPATGQYTFVPNPSFTGTAQTTYTICQYVPPSTVAIQCSTATITINVSNTPPPIIGVAKSATKPEFDGNGCYKVTFKFIVKNYGATPIYSVTVTDNLNNTFVTPATYTVVSMPISSNGILIANTGFNGSSDINLVSSTSSLAVGQTDTISITVRYCTNAGASVTYSNIAMASGNNSPTGTGVTSTVVSTNGTNPDPNGNGIPNETGEMEPTVFVGTGELVIPQGFSPNSDGVNDLFVIKGIGAYPDNKLNILNRWGNVVFKMDGYDNTWNGKSSEGVRYGSDDLPEGTYFYILDLGNGDKPYKGFIYLSKGNK